MDNKKEVTTRQSANILNLMAAKYHLDPEKFKQTIKATVLRPGKDGRVATDEEFMAFLMVANKYNLDPFTNEIYGYPAKKGGIIPVIGVDGYVSKICNHQEFDGMEFSFSEENTVPEGGKECPVWCEVKLYRKGITRPVVIREYIDEVYRTAISAYTGPWQTHTKRMLRHKTIIQAGRVAGFLTGVYDEDEAQRIIEAEYADQPTGKPAVSMPQAKKELQPPAQEPAPSTEETVNDIVNELGGGAVEPEYLTVKQAITSKEGDTIGIKAKVVGVYDKKVGAVKSDRASYLVQEGDIKIYINMWGLGDKELRSKECFFSMVKVSMWNGQPQFMAEVVTPCN